MKSKRPRPMILPVERTIKLHLGPQFYDQLAQAAELEGLSVPVFVVAAVLGVVEKLIPGSRKKFPTCNIVDLDSLHAEAFLPASTSSDAS